MMALAHCADAKSAFTNAKTAARLFGGSMYPKLEIVM